MYFLAFPFSLAPSLGSNPQHIKHLSYTFTSIPLDVGPVMFLKSFWSWKFLTERIEFLVTYGCDRMLKVYFWLVPCGSTMSRRFCLIFFFQINYHLYFWMTSDGCFLRGDSCWLLGKAWLIRTDGAETSHETLPLSVTYDMSWSARPILFSISRASDRLVLGIVKQTLGGKALCYDWREETASSQQNLISAQTSPLLFTTRSLTPMTSEMLPLVTLFYHSNSSHWCRRLWLTGKLERVVIAISPHQLRLWPRTIASLFLFSHSSFFLHVPLPAVTENSDDCISVTTEGY